MKMGVVEEERRVKAHSVCALFLLATVLLICRSPNALFMSAHGHNYVKYCSWSPALHYVCTVYYSRHFCHVLIIQFFDLSRWKTVMHF